MPMASTERPKNSTGNATLLVLYDSSQAESAQLPETIFSALNHFGMPYRSLDLARARLDGVDFHRHAAVVIGQEYLGLRLRPDDVRTLLKAVESGCGLVNVDHDIAAYDDTLCDALGLGGSHPTGRIADDGAEALVVSDNDHFISYTQDAGGTHRFRMPIPIALTRIKRPGPRVLGKTELGAPLVVAVRLGEGRMVQWLVSPRLWTHPYLGHAHGLDDLFWKGIVWVARKPFVMKAMPPFVRLRFDDCSGLWRNRSDFYFVNVLNEFGHKPALGLCMRAVTEDGARKIEQLHSEGGAEFAPHTLKPDTSIFYGDDSGAYSEEELHAIMKEIDELFGRWRVRHSKILSDHNHEYSSKVLPLLKARDICFKMNITLPDERVTDIHVDWRPSPYGSMSYAMDYLPGTRDLFVVFNHYPTWDYNRAYLSDGRFLLNRAGGVGSYKWDFLNGLTTFRRDREINDTEAAARRLASHVALGLNSLFFAGSISHSHFTQTLSDTEWRSLLKRYEHLTARHYKINASYDFIAEYARSNFDTHLARVDRDQVRRDMRCTLEGETTVPIELSVFHDTEDSVEYRSEIVPVFRGQTEVVFSI
jgi:hypothetical protein